MLDTRIVAAEAWSGAVGGDPAEVELGADGAEDRRYGVEQGPDLGVAVALALNRLGVQAHRDVVDENPTVDVAEVHEVLAPVDEGVEGADDIVTVHPEVEGEVVAGARGDARVGQPVFGGRCGDDGLGAVPTRRGQPVGARRDGVVDELLEIVTLCSSTVLIPRSAACSASPTFAAFPPPDHGLTKSTGRRGGSAAGSRRCTRKAARAAACQTATPTTSPSR